MVWVGEKSNKTSAFYTDKLSSDSEEEEEEEEEEENVWRPGLYHAINSISLYHQCNNNTLCIISILILKGRWLLQMNYFICKSYLPFSKNTHDLKESPSKWESEIKIEIERDVFINVWLLKNSFLRLVSLFQRRLCLTMWFPPQQPPQPGQKPSNQSSPLTTTD